LGAAVGLGNADTGAQRLVKGQGVHREAAVGGGQVFHVVGSAGQIPGRIFPFSSGMRSWMRLPKFTHACPGKGFAGLCYLPRLSTHRSVTRKKPNLHCRGRKSFIGLWT
jgi:hypothetical protein